MRLRLNKVQLCEERLQRHIKKAARTSWATQKDKRDCFTSFAMTDQSKKENRYDTPDPPEWSQSINQSSGLPDRTIVEVNHCIRNKMFVF
jgi:hypothetical protein